MRTQTFHSATREEPYIDIQLQINVMDHTISCLLACAKALIEVKRGLEETKETYYDDSSGQ